MATYENSADRPILAPHRSLAIRFATRAPKRQNTSGFLGDFLSSLLMSNPFRSAFRWMEPGPLVIPVGSGIQLCEARLDATLRAMTGRMATTVVP